jgi:hypothetical protein
MTEDSENTIDTNSSWWKKPAWMGILVALVSIIVPATMAINGNTI